MVPPEGLPGGFNLNSNEYSWMGALPFFSGSFSLRNRNDDRNLPINTIMYPYIRASRRGKFCIRYPSRYPPDRAPIR